jgi:DNA-binding NarL/FixJ family response regulator
MIPKTIIQVLVVDDHEMVRASLATLFANSDDLVLMGEAANGQEAVDFCVLRQPDLILMDLNMPGMGGIEATRIICQAHPLMKVLILSNSGTFESIQTAIEAGAKGFIRKNVTGAEIVVVMRAAFFSAN